MRVIDRIEAEAFGLSAKVMLRQTFAHADEAWTVWLGSVPIAMFGVSPASMVDWSGRPWFVGSDAVPACARFMLLRGASFIERWHERYRYLENWVSADNRAAIRMLGRWGFDVGDDPVSFGGVAFLPFRRECSCALIP